MGRERDGAANHWASSAIRSENVCRGLSTARIGEQPGVTRALQSRSPVHVEWVPPTEPIIYSRSSSMRLPDPCELSVNQHLVLSRQNSRRWGAFRLR